MKKLYLFIALLFIMVAVQAQTDSIYNSRTTDYFYHIVRSNKTNGIPFYKLKDKDNNYMQLYLQNQNVYFFNSTATKGFYFNQSIHVDTLFYNKLNPPIVGGGSEEDPIYAGDSAKVVQFGDTINTIATKHDLLSYLPKEDTTSFLHESDSVDLFYNKEAADAKFALLGSGGSSSHKDTLVNFIVATNNKNEFIKNLTIGTSITADRYTTTNSNAVLGKNISTSISSASNNVLIGNYAGYSLTGSYESVCIGYAAGQNGTNGAWYNVFIGREAGLASNGQENVFIGRAAGMYMTTESHRMITGTWDSGSKHNDTTLFRYRYDMKDTVKSVEYPNANISRVGYIKPYKTSTCPTLAPGETAIYIKNQYYIIAYKDGATIKYRYLTLNSTDATWTYATSEP